MQGIIAWLSKLPIAAWIKPLWKGALKALVSAEVEQLRPIVKDAAAKGPAAVDAAFAAFEKKLDDGIDALHLPAWAKSALQSADGAIDQQLEQLRNRIDQAINEGGAGAIDAVFDSGKAVLLTKIDAL